MADFTAPVNISGLKYLYVEKGDEVVILDHREINLYRSPLADFTCRIPELQSDCFREIWIPLCQAEPTPGDVWVPVAGERVAMVISCLFEDLSKPAITHCSQLCYVTDWIQPVPSPLHWCCSGPVGSVAGITQPAFGSLAGELSTAWTGTGGWALQKRKPTFLCLHLPAGR